MRAESPLSGRLFQSHRWTRHFGARQIKRDGVQSFIHRIHQVPRRDVAACARRWLQELSFASIESEEVQALFVRGRAGQHRKEESVAARQHLWPAMADLTVVAIERRDLLTWTSRCRHFPQRGVIGWREVDRVIRSPASALPGRGIAQDLRGTAGDRDPFQFALGKKPNPPAVGRKERHAAAFGAGEAFRLETVQGTDVELSADALLERGIAIDELRPIR